MCSPQNGTKSYWCEQAPTYRLTILMYVCICGIYIQKQNGNKPYWCEQAPTDRLTILMNVCIYVCIYIYIYI